MLRSSVSLRRNAVWLALAVSVLALVVSPWGQIGVHYAEQSVVDGVQAMGTAFEAMFPSATEVGPVPATQTLDVGVGIPVHDPGGLSSYIQATQTVNSPIYHQFLTPGQFDAQYSPSDATYAKVVQYFQSYGLNVQGSGNHLLVGFTGPADKMGAAFHTSFAQYSVNGAIYYGTTGVPELPTGLYVSGVFGLTNYFNAHTANYFAPSTAPPTPLPTGGAPGTPTAACSGGLTPTQVRDAYRLNTLISSGDTGSGEKIAVVDTYDTTEPPSQLTTDLSNFDSSCGVSAITPQYQFPVHNYPASNSSSGWGGETDLDMQWSHQAAQSAGLYPTLTPDSGFSLYEGVNYLVTTHLVDVISLSWGFNDQGLGWNPTTSSWCNPTLGACNASYAGVYAIFHPILQAAVAEGISVTVASGDCGADDGANGVSTDYPASDEDATGIGGSILTMASNGTYYGSETGSGSGWTGNRSGSACNNGGAAGGGWAPEPQPWYQHGPGVKNKGLRGVPDVGITVGAPLATYTFNGITFGFTGVYGTSDGAPQWAGLIATADGMAGHDLGLINPALYGVLRSSAYGTGSYFHQITTGSNGYSATADWNPLSGVGTPITTEFLPYLAGAAFLPPQAPLQVSVSATPTTGAAPLAVTFTVTATGGTGSYSEYNYYWGDGNSNPSHYSTYTRTYSSAGTYASQVEVYDSSGNSTTSVPIMITVGPTTNALSLALAASTTSPTVGQAVTFTATASGGTSPYGFGYYFGDGTWQFANAKSTSPSTINHSFTEVGIYCAAATVNDSSSPELGATSPTLTILVGGATGSCTSSGTPLSITASSNVTSGNAPLMVGFTSTPAGGSGGNTYAWTFGDGGTSTLQNPSHSYTAAGTYSASVTVTDSLSATATSSPISITVVAAGSPLTPTSSANRTSGTPAFAVTFTGGATGGTSPYTWFWSFGDGTSARTQSPSHTYAAAGTYSATLLVNDSASHSVSATPISITVAYPTLSVAASATPTSGASPLNVAFTSVPTGGSWVYTYAWVFGDGATSTSPNPTHLYTTTTTKTFSASVTVTDTASHTATSNTLSITVTPAGAGLAVTATSNVTSGYVSLSVSFTAVPSGGTAPYTSFAWNFGDATSSNLQDPSHVYARTGVFGASVTVTDSTSKTAVSNSITITVNALPGGPLTALSSGSPLSGHAPLSVAFSGVASGGTAPYTYSWNFGNGATSTAQNPLYTYTQAGTFDAVLSVADSASGHATASAVVITVGPAVSTPLGGILNVSSPSVVVGSSVTFAMTVTGGASPYQFSWSGLPPGCTGSNQAVLTCSPSATGSDFLVSIRVVDSSATPQSIVRYTNLTVTAATSTGNSGIFGVDPLVLAILVVAVIAVVVLAAYAVHRARKAPPAQPPMQGWSQPAPPPQGPPDLGAYLNQPPNP